MKAYLIGPAFSSRARGLRSLRAALVERRRAKPARLNAPAIVVAVDGGVDICRALRIRPDYAIGDWDSVRSPKAIAALDRAGTAVVHLPKRKDASDLRFALELLRALRVDCLEAFGFTGGRPDHHLASLLELADADWLAERVARDESSEYRWFSGPTQARFTLGRGRLVSFFALGAPNVRGFKLGGFAYAPRDGRLRSGSHGLSNITRRKDLSLSLQAGNLLMVVPQSIR